MSVWFVCLSAGMYIKKSVNILRTGIFGLRLPCVPIYAKMFTPNNVNICYTENTHYNLSKIEYILNKANA